MQALDTNILVRLFVNDDTAQARKARALFDEHADAHEALWIADTVLVELAWVLERTYDRPSYEIARALEALASNATVKLESGAALISRAAALYEAGPADFADCLLAVKAAAAGCERLRSFDRKMRGLPGVQLL